MPNFRDRVLEWAKEAGLQAYITPDCYPTALRRFARLVRAAALEEAAVKRWALKGGAR